MLESHHTRVTGISIGLLLSMLLPLTPSVALAQAARTANTRSATLLVPLFRWTRNCFLIHRQALVPEALSSPAIASREEWFKAFA
jgi:hypothetical protein